VNGLRDLGISIFVFRFDLDHSNIGRKGVKSGFRTQDAGHKMQSKSGVRIQNAEYRRQEGIAYSVEGIVGRMEISKIKDQNYKLKCKYYLFPAKAQRR
jgi:hypothetical protein